MAETTAEQPLEELAPAGAVEAHRPRVQVGAQLGDPCVEGGERDLQADMTAISKRLEAQYPDENKDWGALVRPLQDRERFKDSATRFLIGGLVAASLALILATQLVVSQVLGDPLPDSSMMRWKSSRCSSFMSSATAPIRRHSPPDRNSSTARLSWRATSPPRPGRSRAAPRRSPSRTARPSGPGRSRRR